MSWAYPLFFSGLISLAAPFLVHFLMKTQGRKVPFSTLRFLKKIEGTREKKKIRHWALLFLRMLILALLAAAFARPFQATDYSGPPPAKRRHAVIIVLDQSASMQASNQAGDSCWNEAVIATRRILESLSASDRVAIVTDAEEARIATPWTSPVTALDLLARLEPTNEAGRLADGLRLAGTLLDHTSAEFQRELILVSDLQRSSCQNLDSVALPAGVHYEIKSMAVSQDANLAITDLVPEGLLGSVSRVNLKNFSSDNIQGVSLSVSVDQHPLSQVALDIEKNGRGSTTFSNSSLAPGWHDLELKIQRSDALAPDNQFYAAISVPQPTKVLIIEPHPDEKIYRRSSYFVASALDPAPEAEDGQSSFKPFAVTIVSPDAVPNALASNVPQVMVLPPLSEIPPGLGVGLKNYVEQGGGLLVWGGDGLDLLGYNAEFGDFLPARFSSVETNGDAMLKGSWRLDPSPKEDSSVFQMFQKPGHGDLTLAGFRQRLRLDLGPGAEVLETFEDKMPFLISGRFGRGRVLVVNSSPDTHWSDWPLHKTFLPLIDQMARYLSDQEQDNTFLVARSVDPTRNGEFALNSDHADESVQIVRPDGKIMQSQADKTGTLHHLDFEQLGHYQIRNLQNEVMRHFCVNFPIVESNLDGMDAREITGMLHFRHDSNDDLLSISADQHARREWWPYLMALLIPLLFLELTWGNRSRA